MSRKCSVSHEELIDYLEGEISGERAEAIGTHIDSCAECARYVRSLRETYEVLKRDRVPEPPPGFLEYLPQRVRAQAASRRRRLVLRLVPGLATAVAAVIAVWWWVGGPRPEADTMDLLIADMSTQEIVESVSEIPVLEEVFLLANQANLAAAEVYFTDTDGIYDLVNSLSESEANLLISEIGNRIDLDDNTSKAVFDPIGKEC